MKFLLSLSLSAALMAGCSLFGPNAAAPTTAEQLAFNTTNVPMVTVHNITNYVNVTNVIDKVVPQIVTVTVTNEVGVIVPRFVTNLVTIQVTNITKTPDTVIPAGTPVTVPQLAGATPAVQSGLAMLNSVPSWGTIAAAVIALGFGGYQMYRNKSLTASYTAATSDPTTIVANLKTVAAHKASDNTALQQAATVLSALPTPPKV